MLRSGLTRSTWSRFRRAKGVGVNHASMPRGPSFTKEPSGRQEGSREGLSLRRKRPESGVSQPYALEGREISPALNETGDNGANPGRIRAAVDT